jgi:hypothetical protein
MLAPAVPEQLEQPHLWGRRLRRGRRLDRLEERADVLVWLVHE